MLGFKLNHVSKRVSWYLKLLISGCLNVVKAIKHVYNESATFCESYSVSININGPLNLTEAVTAIGTEDHLTLGIADFIKSAAMKKLMPFPPKSTQSCCNLWYHRGSFFFSFSSCPALCSYRLFHSLQLFACHHGCAKDIQSPWRTEEIATSLVSLLCIAAHIESAGPVYIPQSVFRLTNHTSDVSIQIDLFHKFHNAPVPYPTMHHFVSEMCAHFCYQMVHCGIFV